MMALFSTSKKGQATAFFILGVVIAMLIVIGVYYRDVLVEKFREELPKTAVEREADEIKTFVESCVSSLAEDAVEQIGMRGGYIELPKDEIAVNLANPMLNRLVVLPGLETAYWFYEQGNGIQKLSVPSIESMQNEIEKYIDDNLPGCIGDFNEFTSKVSWQKPRSNAEILEKSIEISTRFPLTIVRDETTVKKNIFAVNLDKPLGELYSNAKQIFEKEMGSNFLEEKTLDLFVVYDQIPYDGVDFECTQKTWSKFEAMRNIKDIVSNNVYYLKVAGTNYGLADARHKYFEIDALKNKDEKLDVAFMFSKEWPMLIDVLPDDAIMKSDSFTSSSAARFAAQFFCLNYWNFVYSIKYPVLITLSKDDYTFQFATQVVIDKNQPKKSMVDVAAYEGRKARVCERPLTRMNVNVLGFDRDGNLNEIENARVSFKCLGVACDIGAGNKDLMFPQCINGMIAADAAGYDRNEVMVSTNSGQELSINLEPIYEKDMAVFITREEGGDRSLLASEIVMLHFEDKEQGYSASAFYPYDKKIRLIAGNYNVKATLIANLTTPLQLKEEKIKSCVTMPKKGLLGLVGLTEKKCSEAVMPAVKLDQAIAGGVEFKFSLNRQELADAGKLSVYVIRNRLPESVNDITKIMESVAKNKDNKYFKAPILK